MGFTSGLKDVLYGQQTTPGDTAVKVDNQGHIGVNLFSVNGSALFVVGGNGDGQPTPQVLGTVAYLFNGTNYDRPRTPNLYKTIAAVAVTAGTPVTIWTPANGKKFRVMGFVFGMTVAGSVILKDGASAEILRVLVAAGASQSSPPMGNGYLSTTANNTLQVDVSASGSVSGFVFGTEE